MAQLLKLADYVSRYEIDIYRYPSRYVRLKKERWLRLKQDWEATRSSHGNFPLFQHYEEETSLSLWKRTRSMFSRKDKNETKEEVDLPTDWQLRHRSLEEIKTNFLQELLEFQLNWASSTVSEISHLNREYYNDKLLQYLLQELPDTFFIFYHPVLFARKAPVDCDIIILSPNDLWIITPLHGNKETIFSALEGRYWQRRDEDQQESFLHPNISLKRTKTVIQSILEKEGLSIPVRTAILSKDSYIDVGQGTQLAKLIDRRNLFEFRDSFLKMQAPIKHTQLKIADAILQSSLTISESRLNADIEEDSLENEK
ncbi:nuclease-related domain-containing protein [Alkalicoccus daliensis]|uniref:Nuclease-related domain-containing protein n=1 Tax=Alkalicoccus daliensis TaxID=745820 RepID=A0A1H0H2D3_9BACI|nr:nuclease-related domain-containing protein [Alkalicoccus daliensis]SDO13298.1 Nuclease-related domain-containing protein [Alkalicoccus daliensis]